MTGLDGNLAAVQDSVTGTEVELTNLHGDVVATMNPTTTDLGATANFDSVRP